MRTELLLLNGAVERDPAIDAWMREHAGELGALADHWFGVMRKCGDEWNEEKNVRATDVGPQRRKYVTRRGERKKIDGTGPEKLLCSRPDANSYR
jgi:hypothetical protein